MKKVVLIILIFSLLLIGCTNNRKLTNEFLQGFLMGLSTPPPSVSTPSLVEIECDAFGTCYIYQNGRLIGTCTPHCWGGQCYCW